MPIATPEAYRHMLDTAKSQSFAWYVNHGDHGRRSHPAERSGSGSVCDRVYLGCQAAGSRVTLNPWASSLATRRRLSFSGSMRVVK